MQLSSKDRETENQEQQPDLRKNQTLVPSQVVGIPLRVEKQPVDFLGIWQDNFVYVPILEAWIQRGIVNLERELRKSQYQTHEQVLMFDLSAKTHIKIIQVGTCN